MPSKSLRVCTMNLENLFSPDVKFYNNQYTRGQYERKTDWIAQTLASCQVHVAELVEVGEHSDKCLQDVLRKVNEYDQTLKADPPWPKLRFYYNREAAESGAPIRTSVVSRFPIKEPITLKDDGGSGDGDGSRGGAGGGGGVGGGDVDGGGDRGGSVDGGGSGGASSRARTLGAASGGGASPGGTSGGAAAGPGAADGPFIRGKGRSLVNFPDSFFVDIYPPHEERDHDKWVKVPLDAFSRPVTMVRIESDGGLVHPFNLFVVHLKSKRPVRSTRDRKWNEASGIARSAIKRNMEAAALRYYLDDFLPTQYEADEKVATLVAGDFNDTPTSVPFENIRGSFDVVPGPASTWSRLDKRRLVSCARLHMKKKSYEDKLYSYVHNESFSLIDQILVSEHLTGKFRGVEVLNDHVLRHQRLSSVVDPVRRQYKSEVSDHGVVVVELNRMLK